MAHQGHQLGVGGWIPRSARILTLVGILLSLVQPIASPAFAQSPRQTPHAEWMPGELRVTLDAGDTATIPVGFLATGPIMSVAFEVHSSRGLAVTLAPSSIAPVASGQMYAA